MAQRIQAVVEPSLIVWARESAGYQLEEAAKKLGVKPDRLRQFESGKVKPTISQLRKMGEVYKRPIAVFFLPEPPKTFDALHDFRRLPGEVARIRSPQLRLEIRRAQYRRDVALDLYRELGMEPPGHRLSANLEEDPEAVGERIRETLGITYENQVKWKSPHDGLNAWRDALEDIGVLVFQASGIEVSEMRGFSIGEWPLPVVVLNMKDSPRARIFTLLHEFTHILLKQSGICDMDEEYGRGSEELRTEVFCNHVAGAAMVPRDNLLQEDIVVERGSRPSQWTDEQLATLSSRYGASKEVILRRLLITGRTTESFYQAKRAEFRELRRMSPKRKPRGFVPPHVKAVASAGPHFTRLVLASFHQDRLTLSTVSDLLEVRVKHVQKIEAAVLSRSFDRGAA